MAVEGQNGVFFTLAKLILEKELIYACEAWSFVVCMCTRAMQVWLVHALADVEPRLMDSLEVESCVQGHHVYRNVWIPEIGQLLECVFEQGNSKDPYAIIVLHGGYKKTVRHLPRKISAACSVFLRNEGQITCFITAPRRYSANLPQGGLEGLAP